MTGAFRKDVNQTGKFINLDKNYFQQSSSTSMPTNRARGKGCRSGKAGRTELGQNFHESEALQLPTRIQT